MLSMGDGFAIAGRFVDPKDFVLSRIGGYVDNAMMCAAGNVLATAARGIRIVRSWGAWGCLRVVAMGVLVAVAATVAPPALAEDLAVDYLYRYDDGVGVRHIMCSLATGADRMIVGGMPGVVLVDLAALTPGGSTAHLSILRGLETHNLYQKGETVFANLHATGGGGSFGFAVIQVDGDNLKHIDTVDEPDVFYEKMCISGDYLYVAAHNDGIRVFNIVDPENPVSVGGIATGFADAFDIDVEGDTAYVADGPDGLKVVDVSDRALPRIVDSENPANAVGASEAVAVKAGKVYVAAGSSGLAIYDQSDITARTLIPLDGYAEDLAWHGDYLVVSHKHGFSIFDTSGAVPTLVGHESCHRRGASATLRICEEVVLADSNRLLCANWSYLDVSVI